MDENKNKKPDTTLKPIESDVHPEEVKTTVGTAAVDDRFKEVEEKIKFVREIMYFMVTILLVGFMAAIIAYFQFVADLNRDYKNALEELSNQKFQFMQNQIDNLK